MEHTGNHIQLRGSLVELPTFSHENHGRKFYKFPLEVPRLSGASDILHVVASLEVLEEIDVFGGQILEVTGQIRSFNSRGDTGRRLIISVYATAMVTCDLEPLNQVQLSGVICKAPVLRRTPLGREICDVMLAVNRPYRRTDYLPCILWGKTAQDMADLAVGAKIQLTGRLQSRNYIKIMDGESIQRTAYEISAMTATLATDAPSPMP